MNQNFKPQFNGVVILVDNITNSKKFYVDILHQEIEMDFGRCVTFSSGFSIWSKEYALMMMQIDTTHNQSCSPENFELYFEINSIDSFFEYIKKKKVDFLHGLKEQPWGQCCFRLYDPDKHIIEFAETMDAVIRRLHIDGCSEEMIIKKTMMPKKHVQMVINEIST